MNKQTNKQTSKQDLGKHLYKFAPDSTFADQQSLHLICKTKEILTRCSAKGLRLFKQITNMVAGTFHTPALPRWSMCTRMIDICVALRQCCSVRFGLSDLQWLPRTVNWKMSETFLTCLHTQSYTSYVNTLTWYQMIRKLCSEVPQKNRNALW